MMSNPAGYLLPDTEGSVVCNTCATDEPTQIGWALLFTPRTENYLIDLKCCECGVTI